MKRKPGRLRVATFNLRFIVDRWSKRRPLVLKSVFDLRADVVCLQEVVNAGALGRFLSVGQADRIVQDLNVRMDNSTPMEDWPKTPGWGKAHGYDGQPPPGGFAGFSHGEPAEYLRSGFGQLPEWASMVLFDLNPLWHLWLLVAAIFNEIFLEVIFGKYLMPVFAHALGPIAFLCTGTALVFGKATLLQQTTLSCSDQPEVLRIGAWRTAQRLLVTIKTPLDASGIPSKKLKLWVVNVHLHSGRATEREAVREAQVKSILAWMATVASRADGIVILGDFNAGPVEPAYRHLLKKGFRSCYLTKHGDEPACTFPGEGKGLLSSTKDNDKAGTFDYVFMVGDVQLTEGGDVALFADQPSARDPTLFPSDHYGVFADITVGSAKDKAAAAKEMARALGCSGPQQAWHIGPY
jgi:endonuclease/exonuclease/phosphatase family metal-dependent hydrolase